MRQSKKSFRLFGLIATLALVASNAGAAVVPFVFKGALPGPTTVDAPINSTTPCGSPGFDFCDVGGAGLDYAKDGVSFTAFGLANGLPSELIQDIKGLNQGLGVLSEGQFTLDQINFDALESVLFTFDEEVTLTNVELNNGTGQDCPFVGREGGCGAFDLVLDRGLASELTFSNITALAILPGGWRGVSFEFIAVTPDAGFSIAAFDVSMPLPAALPLFLAGLGGITALRRKNLLSKKK